MSPDGTTAKVRVYVKGTATGNEKPKMVRVVANVPVAATVIAPDARVTAGGPLRVTPGGRPGMVAGTATMDAGIGTGGAAMTSIVGAGKPVEAAGSWLSVPERKSCPSNIGLPCSSTLKPTEPVGEIGERIKAHVPF
jgi:hypothetical protein